MIGRKVLYIDNKYNLTEKDLIDYTILCLRNRGVSSFNINDLFKSFYDVNSKYNEKRYNCVFDVYVDAKGKIVCYDLIDYLKFNDNNRREYLRILKSGDFSRFEFHNMTKKRLMDEMLNCGFGLYNQRTGEVKSVFNRIFSSSLADKIYDNLDPEICSIFEEVAEGIVQLQNEKDNLENGEDK